MCPTGTNHGTKLTVSFPTKCIAFVVIQFADDLLITGHWQIVKKAGYKNYILFKQTNVSIQCEWETGVWVRRKLTIIRLLETLF